MSQHYARATPKLQKWLRRGIGTISPGDEAELLTEILSVRKGSKTVLKSLAQSKDCQTLFRCAAMDQYLRLVLDDSKKHLKHKELFGTKEFLKSLANFETEPNEDVRFVAGQWFAQLLTDHPTLSRAKSPEAAEKEWRELLQNDPSPRVKSLSTLGVHVENSNIVIGNQNVVQRGKFNVKIDNARGIAIGDNARADYREDDE